MFHILHHYSLFELVEKIISIFSLNKDKAELPFIRAFQEYLVKFIKKGNADINAFLEYWDEKGASLTVQLSEVKDAIKIMTVHKSKGLAFKIVLIPYLDWKLNDNNAMNKTIIWADTKESKFNTFPFIPLVYDKNLKNSEFSDYYLRETFYSYIDTLNLFYVALTRAKERIYAFVNKSKKGNGSTIGDYIFKAINTETKISPLTISPNQFFDQANSRFEFEDDYIVEPKEESKEQESAFDIEEYPSHDWTNNIAIIAATINLIDLSASPMFFFIVLNLNFTLINIE